MRRRLLALLVLVPLAAAGAAACSDDGDGGGGGGADGGVSPTDDAGPVEQNAPLGANGITIDDEGQLWIAVLTGDEILRVDHESGEILERYPTPARAGPDDLVIGDDGTVYWTGYTSGEVGALDPTTRESIELGNVGPGANPIAQRGDGMLLVGRAITGTGLYLVDPAGGEEPEPLADPGNVNSFSIGPDGLLYSPLIGPEGGAAVAIDPEVGEVRETVAPIEGIPVALRWHDDALYVLTLNPGGVVYRVDLASRAVELFADTGLTTADNLAVADDGTVYVTGFDQPVIAVFDAEGRPQDPLDIGRGG